jgi:thiol-disulfide isomerase/thioredoxin
VDDQSTRRGGRSGGAAESPGLIRSIVHRLAGDPATLPFEGRLGSLSGATGWLNSEPLTPEGLRGGVVLVDFWTYTCVNWLRTLPYVRAWHEKYRDTGLTIVSVHTPEFGFERTIENVRRHAARLGVTFPVAVDSDYGVWRAFSNHYWPAVYVADAEGRIRFHHFGEGEYAMTEMVIQQLLLDAGETNFDRDLVSVEPRGLEVAADWSSLRSPETYLGYRQAVGFAPGQEAIFDAEAAYDAPATLSVNHWALTGTWTVAAHGAVSAAAGGRIVFQFHARDVNLVMGSLSPATAVRFRVFLDGRPPGESIGTDVDPTGTGIVDAQRTFQLIRQPGRISDRRFEIEFLDPGVEAYCFTFG